MSLTQSVVFVGALAVFAHLAYDDWRELQVWGWEVALLAILSGAYAILVGAPTLTLAIFIGLVSFVFMALYIFHVADALALVSVVLLSKTPLEASLVLLVLVLVDIGYRLSKCGFSGECPTPLITELFGAFAVVKVLEVLL